MRGASIVRGSIGARSSDQRASKASGTPDTASLASPERNGRRPEAPLASSATARWGRPFRMRPTKPVSTEPGPTSTKVRTPAACMASICSTKRTGSAICAASVSRTRLAS